MIHYICRDGHQNTIAPFLCRFGGALRKVVRITTYEEILSDGALAPGHLIFTDLDRLSRSGLKAAQIIADTVRGTMPEVRIFNEPKDVLLRHALLTALWEDGVNPFHAVRLGGGLPSIRFPVFIRREGGAFGPESPLLNSEQDLLDALAARGECDERLLAVEYCAERSSDGYFRKFGAFRVGDQILPQHIQFSDQWIVKQETSITSPQLVTEEMRYIEANPHKAALKQIFARARIEFGRIDYSFVDRKLVVYEINTNPMFPHGNQRNGRQHLRLIVGRRLVEALKVLDSPLSSGRTIRLVNGARLRHVRQDHGEPHCIWQLMGRSPLLDRAMALYWRALPDTLRRRLPIALKASAMHALDSIFIRRPRLGMPRQ